VHTATCKCLEPHAEDERRMTEIQKLKTHLEPSLLGTVDLKPVQLKIKIKGSAVSARLNLSKHLESIEKLISL
jgi:hypothetical protein